MSCWRRVRKQLGGCQPAMAQPTHCVFGHLFVSNTCSELKAALLQVFSDASPGAVLKLHVACSKEFFQQSKIISHLSSLRVSSVSWCCSRWNPAGMVALQPSRFKLNLCTETHLGSHCSGPRHGGGRQCQSLVCEAGPSSLSCSLRSACWCVLSCHHPKQQDPSSGFIN